MNTEMHRPLVSESRLAHTRFCSGR